MISKLIQTIGVGLAASAATAFAGDFSADPITPVPSSGGNGGDWCKGLQDIGTVYKNKENPWIQEVKFFGRAHYQWGYSDGDVNGDDFSGNGDELRRLRAGASIKFLNGFKAVGRANFEYGGFRNTRLGYDNNGDNTPWDELYLEYALGDITVGYGHYKLGFGGEESMSSKKIKTIERSLLNNTVEGGARVTGGRVGFSAGPVDFLAGVYTTDGADETFGQWDGGTVYHIDASFEALGGDVLVQGLYKDANGAEPDETVGADWAAAITYQGEFGPLNLFVNGTYGDFDHGDVYGVVVMPSMFLIEDKLEAVIRYQWAHSTGDRLRLQSRNVRNVYRMDGVADLRGDDHHSIYAGLNYFICDHNLKLMAGVEYETLDGPAVDTEATTLWGAVRFYF
jgi:hypothetical protein